MEEVYEFIKDCGCFFIATVDGDKPKVRPFGAINIFENKLYIQTGKRKKVSEQMQSNPNIEICALKDNRWVRVEGKVVRDDRIEAKQSLLDAYPELKGMYSADDDNTDVLYFENAKATFYSFTDKPRVIEF